MSEYTDREINCKDCKTPFTFTAGEQQFFAERQFTDPVRCKPCRDVRKAQKDADGGGSPDGGGHDGGRHRRR